LLLVYERKRHLPLVGLGRACWQLTRHQPAQGASGDLDQQGAAISRVAHSQDDRNGQVADRRADLPAHTMAKRIRIAALPAVEQQLLLGRIR
jgi:hypothetical protein